MDQKEAEGNRQRQASHSPRLFQARRRNGVFGVGNNPVNSITEDELSQLNPEMAQLDREERQEYLDRVNGPGPSHGAG